MIASYNNEDLDKLFTNIIPNEITREIVDFCKEIVPNSTPVKIPYEPEFGAVSGDCYINIEKKIKQSGGKIQYGWNIRQINNLFLEAEFHAVWKSDSCELLDITPQESEAKHIIFLPDMKREYQGRQVSNIFMNISGNTLIDDYISIFEAIFYMENKGGRAEQHGLVLNQYEIRIKMELVQLSGFLLIQAQTGKTKKDQCFCGSNEKYKHCHGKILHKHLKKIYSR